MVGIIKSHPRLNLNLARLKLLTIFFVKFIMNFDEFSSIIDPNELGRPNLIKNDSRLNLGKLRRVTGGYVMNEGSSFREANE